MREAIKGSACLDWINLPLVIGGNLCRTIIETQHFKCYLLDSTKARSAYSRLYGVEQYAHTGRLIGYVTDDIDIDGKHRIVVFGNGGISPLRKYIDCEYRIIANYKFHDGQCDGTPHIVTYNSTGNAHDVGAWAMSNTESMVDTLPFVNLFWSTYEGTTLNPFLKGYSLYRGNSILHNANEWILSTDENNTMEFATGKTALPDRQYHQFHTLTYDDIEYYNGNVIGAIDAVNIIGAGTCNGLEVNDFPVNITTILGNDEVYNFNMLPFNLLLTKSKTEAIKYVNDGTLPHDVYLYPFDVDNIPASSDDQPDDGSDDPDENPDVNDDIEPTPLVTPVTTPTSLTNNNIYWLQGGQLETFINWFWTDAGDIADLQSLWQKIEGLYNNLASALINIRYMPIDISWVGGATDVNTIVIGQIEKSMSVKQINKGNPIVRTIGSINISEVYKSFTDYSPFCTVMLYLPYHGFIDINTDIIMGHTLVVKAVYDYLAGTIQYFIFRNETLINSVISKMAVDIPITLQSKGERDSAIFSNVANATANIMGAVASTTTSNPIGLIMSTENVANGGAQTAPFSLKGTVGETGAFYSPNKCAIYIERPRYNKPQLYASRVGYPLNKNYKLSSLSGFTTCYNPTINFNGNTVSTDDSKAYPLESEIAEIYDYLEKGVIL